MFRSSLKTSRQLLRKQPSRSLSKKFYQTKDDPNRLVPYYTIAACAVTSASMYYYFMHRVSNESNSNPSDLAGKTVQVISSPAEIDTVQVISSPAEVETVQVVSSPAEVETEQVEATTPSGEIETNENSEPVEVIDVIVTPSEMNDKPVEIVDVIDTVEVDGEPVASEESVAVVEAETQAGAYNEETGEINWDCPCLGGMADGPCGEEFKSAFSCFVYSKDEPKGIECIPNFKNMQDCFRKYPEYYSEELRDEEELTHEVAGDVKAGEMNQEIINDIQEATAEAQGIAADIAKDLAAAEHAVQEKIETVNLKAGDAYRQARKPDIDLYGSAQAKIDDFNKK